MFHRLAYLFMLYYVVIGMTQPQNRFLFLYPFRIAQLAFIIAMIFHVMAFLQEERPLLRFGPATKLCLFLIPWGLMAQYFGPLVTNTAWNGYIDQLIKSAVAVILLEATATNIYRVWGVYGAILASTLWWLKAGLRLGTAGAVYAGDRIMGPAVAMVENPNAYAYFTCVTIIVYLYFHQQSKNKYLRLASLAFTIASIWIVFNTGSRTGMVLLVAMSAFLFPKYGGQHKVALLLIVAATPLFLSTVGVMNIERFRTIPESFGAFIRGEEVSLEMAQGADEHSAIERRLKNEHTWELIKMYPLIGVGMNPNEGRYPSGLPQARGQVHNEMLMAGRQMGLPGMAMYLAMLGIMFHCGLRVQRYAKKWWPAMADFGWSLKLQALVIFVGGQFNPLPWNTYTMVLLGAASVLWLNLQEERIYPEGYAEVSATEDELEAQREPQIAVARSG